MHFILSERESIAIRNLYKLNASEFPDMQTLVTKRLEMACLETLFFILVPGDRGGLPC